MRPQHRLNITDRLVASLVAAACLGVLLVAAWLTPSAKGYGTHTGLGLPACAWEAAFGKPCPTCGMTTAFAHAADGDFTASFRTQPFAMLLALLAASGFWAALHAAWTGSRIGLMYEGLIRPRSMLVAGAAALAAWIYKLTTWTG